MAPNYTVRSVIAVLPNNMHAHAGSTRQLRVRDVMWER